MGKLTGLNIVATLKLCKIGNDLKLSAAGGKWLDKAAVMGVSMVVLWPLFFTSAIGFARQRKLIARLMNEALSYLEDDDDDDFYLGDDDDDD